MCETCRGRHRVYASTKRARRKMEKAAVAGVVAARARVGEVGGDEGDSGDVTAVWMPLSVADQTEIHQGTQAQAGQQDQQAQGWDHAIDPRLFQVPGQGATVPPSSSTSSPLHPHLVTTTSELANALTLPVTVSSYAGYAQREEERFQQPVASSTQEDQGTMPTPASDDMQSPHSEDQPQGQEQEQHEEEEEDDPTVPTRRCSVKGCKKVIRGMVYAQTRILPLPPFPSFFSLLTSLLVFTPTNTPNRHLRIQNVSPLPNAL
ncbi:uncharacterized protein LACBIDRAFT_299800 [Laccaria bicolor S238N-H82]|uniref:Predicted protein n=1 Tax=Laccaria bicolor (strain S238N-H82 / ATCC MYA-4686) TaxID=486041 RepID=B0DFG2_LACBS|nr:uncharacterized protein LACBIDRAFT_299800 [Laccaria bicolor S238N-H82]EDR06701.1 predicted protein [Laccaria bicolor S238N-H82]|eukprot:XP_001882548.1 predicted protein [Laccaria bicolor S238N-H82]